MPRQKHRALDRKDQIRVPMQHRIVPLHCVPAMTALRKLVLVLRLQPPIVEDEAQHCEMHQRFFAQKPVCHTKTSVLIFDYPILVNLQRILRHNSWQRRNKFHACRKYFHGQFLRYETKNYRAQLPKLLSFYAFLWQVHIFALLNYTN